MLAEHLIKAKGDVDGQILVDMFRLLTSRRPTETELEVLCELLAKQMDYFKADPERAVSFLSVGDAPTDETIDSIRLAAFAAVANTLMSFDDSITKQ